MTIRQWQRTFGGKKPAPAAAALDAPTEEATTNEFSYNGAAFNTNALVDLDALEDNLRDSLKKHELLASGMDAHLLDTIYPNVKPMTNAQCNDAWTETYDNLSPQQLLLIEFRKTYDVYLTEQRIRNAIHEVDKMDNAEREAFFGGLWAAGLITIVYTEQDSNGVQHFKVRENKMPFRTPKRSIGGNYGSPTQ